MLPARVRTLVSHSRKMTTNKTPTLHPRLFPRPPLLEHTPRHLEIKWHDKTIASTTSALWVLETYHPPTYYLPPSALSSAFVSLTPTKHTSFCEWKGRATYYAATLLDAEGEGKGRGEVVCDRIWSYDSPTEGFKDLKGYLSFYAGPWECFVDGERVVAQPGDFYGGWMTSDVEGKEVKGAPGTRGW